MVSFSVIFPISYADQQTDYLMQSSHKSVQMQPTLFIEYGRENRVNYEIATSYALSYTYLGKYRRVISASSSADAIAISKNQDHIYEKESSTSMLFEFLYEMWKCGEWKIMYKYIDILRYMWIYTHMNRNKNNVRMVPPCQTCRPKQKRGVD